MTIALSVEINGKQVPLTECDWVMWAPCGCPQGVTVAALPASGRVIATEDAAWKEFYDRKRDSDRARRQGLRLELMTHERYCREASPRMTEKCQHRCDCEMDRQEAIAARAGHFGEVCDIGDTDG